LIVIDASAAIALLLNENAALSASHRLEQLSEQSLMAPSHWPAEVGNALVVNVRRGRMESAQIDDMTDRLRRLGVQIEAAPGFEDMATIAHQASNSGLTYYDAAYVYTAQTHRARLLTLDERMRAAASQLDVPLFIW
jgi:predicted nucleic acid-binding protein